MILPLKFLLALSVVMCLQKVNYKKYVLYEVFVKTREHIHVLIVLFRYPCVDYFNTIGINRTTLAFVGPNCQNLFTKALNDSKIMYKIRRRKKESTQEGQNNKYPTADEIYHWMNGLAANFSEKVTLTTIGQSYEKRNLTVIQVASDSKTNKPIIFVNSAMHGRCWFGPVVVQYFVSDLLNPTNSYLLERVEWHFLPLANPDGYIYSQNYDILWRKTRSRQGDGIGVDVNRNFDCHWNGSTSNKDPSYGGPSAFSECETRSIADYINTWKNRIKLYLSFDNYGNYIIFPWGYTTDYPIDHGELQKLAEDVNDAMVQAGCEKYTIGTVSDVCHSVSGIDVDWVKSKAGIELAYNIELPRGESTEFNPPLSHTKTISKHVSHGMAVFGKYVAEKFGK